MSERMEENKNLSITPFKVPTSTPSKKKKVILDEDTYTEEIGKIIERDFYPDLPTLKTQAEYIQAAQNNDILRLSQLHAQLEKSHSEKSRPVSASPATFETPSTHGDDTEDSEKTKPEVPKAKEQTLDKFLNKVTSEDNASFAEILEENERRRREKLAWLYDREGENEDRREKLLALPALSDNDKPPDRPASLDTWSYTNQNFLMYVPDGVEPSAEEKLNQAERRIIFENTRLQTSPFNEYANRQAISEMAHMQARTLEGKIGVDGKEVLPKDTPSVNGFKYVKTPSPAPGVNETPIMTWGEIEGTPYRLDATPGPTFRIPEVPLRDKLAKELADKAGQRHRQKKKDALRAAKAQLSTSPYWSRSQSNSERLASMSPAAQKLAGRKMGSDRALRESYGATPSPGHTGTPGTPASPWASPIANRSSLTDNLLQLPKNRKTSRMAASDFFK